ncbi:hypothetical protein ADU20_05880 [Burkholderia pseudomallei]|nr:hypothetical protein ADU20_05880 [Burkholderia pseudomallei]
MRSCGIAGGGAGVRSASRSQYPHASKWTAGAWSSVSDGSSTEQIGVVGVLPYRAARPSLTIGAKTMSYMANNPSQAVNRLRERAVIKAGAEKCVHSS